MAETALVATRLFDDGVMQNPYSFYRDLHREAPVWRVPGTDVFVVSSYALLTEATSRIADFSSNLRYLLYRDSDGMPQRFAFGDHRGQVLGTADPPSHTVHKNAAFPNFAVKRMALLEGEIGEIATQHIERALGIGNMDFMAEVANRVPVTVISRLIGFRNSNLERLWQAAIGSTEMLAGANSLQWLQKMLAQTDDVSAWIAEQLALAAKEPDQDVLTALAGAVDAGTITVSDAIIMLHTFLSAGGESTTSLIGNAVRILAEHPDIQHQVRRYPELIPAFLEEVLRVEAPFRSHLRSVTKDTVLGSVAFPAGATVLMLWAAANRDPNVFEDADEIVFDRTRRHFAFGRGIHFCVGAPLARLEAKVTLSILLARSRNIALDPAHPPRWTNSIMVRRHEHLHVTITPN